MTKTHLWELGSPETAEVIPYQVSGNSELYRASLSRHRAAPVTHEGRRPADQDGRHEGLAAHQCELLVQCDVDRDGMTERGNGTADTVTHGCITCGNPARQL